MNGQYDVVVLGGGAAGMTAAIWARRQGASVLLIEYNDMLGKKILSTGNGRCNLSNRRISASSYRSDSGGEDFFSLVFSKVSVEETLDFFESLGILTIEEQQRIYPRTMRAADVREALALALSLEGVEVCYGTKVRQIRREDGVYRLLLPRGGEILAKRLILATGSPASAVSGSTDDGAYYAAMLGHTVRPFLPALVPLRFAEKNLKELAGIRCHDTKVSLWIDGAPAGRSRGELQFTAETLSGIVIFQLSRYAALAAQEKKTCYCLLDLVPEKTEEELFLHWSRRIDAAKGTMTLQQAAAGSLHGGVLSYIARTAGLPLDRPLTRKDVGVLRTLAAGIKAFRVDLDGPKGKKDAQICAGGVCLSEVDAVTMESKLNPGLFFAGELLDVDGKCGGYNLQWAWTSGRIAGEAAGRGDSHD